MRALQLHCVNFRSSHNVIKMSPAHCGLASCCNRSECENDFSDTGYATLLVIYKADIRIACLSCVSGWVTAVNVYPASVSNLGPWIGKYDIASPWWWMDLPRWWLLVNKVNLLEMRWWPSGYTRVNVRRDSLHDWVVLISKSEDYPE